MIFLTFLDKLKEFVKVELNWNAPLIDNRKVIIVNDSYKQNSENKKSTSLIRSDENDNLFLDISKLNNEQKEKLKLIVPEYLQEGSKLLQLETANLLENLYSYNRNNTDKQILEFFKCIVPPNDLEALEASLYLRHVFHKHENVSDLKRNIRETFGLRGNNIANLCTAGYFEEFLIPLYNSSKERFTELYELIVSKSIIAVFVHQGININEIPNEINEKIQISKKYGIGFIHIHGIGERNIMTIKECISKNESFNYFEKKVFEKDNILIIELLLK